MNEAMILMIEEEGLHGIETQAVLCTDATISSVAGLLDKEKVEL